MDNFVYKYEELINDGKNNQLSWVEDLAGASLFSNVDIDNSMGADNYTYDAIGRLIADEDENITSIEWTVSNKVKQINYTDGRQIRFDYDPMGQRVGKHVTEGSVTTSTYYVLDALGSTMSVYQFDNTENNVYLRERNIYGSSRLGQEQLYMQMGTTTYQYNGLLSNEAGDKRYELSNHLGNVLQVVSDSKLPGGSGAYYTADVKNWSDYYPFGMQFTGRNGSEGEYRYGFGAQERDDEVSGAGNSYTAEFWQYSPRIVKRWNVDPMTAKYPWQSPYAVFNNNPIIFNDPLGLEGQDWIGKKNADGSVGWKWDENVKSEG